MHPSEEIKGAKSKKLLKKRIILAVTGSIAAVETIKLARELIRHEAEIIPVMTESATHIIHPDALEFATGKKPITQLTGKTEHVYYCGKTKNPVDLLLISPCTANTISKIAHGIDDTPVTTFASTALGSKIPIMIVPAMHISMYNNKAITENIKKCKKMNMDFIDPKIQSNKAKMADTTEIVNKVIRKIGPGDLKKNQILIIGGATAEPIDDIRIITNKSSGKTAKTLAQNAYERGAEITLWYGHATEEIPPYIQVTHFKSINDLIQLVRKTKLSKYNTIIVCAAIADYQPKKQPGKIKSGEKTLTIELSPTPKIIQQIRKKTPKSKIVAYKVEETKTNLQQKSKKFLIKNKLDFVIANTLKGFEQTQNEIWIIDKKGKTTHIKDTKTKLANQILTIIK